MEPAKPRRPAAACCGRNISQEVKERAIVFPVWKRFLDLTCVAILLPLLLPLGCLIIIWIKMASPGPAFFRQNRIGLRGKEFMCLKFRTMVINADQGAHQEHLRKLMRKNGLTQKLECMGDPRIIPGGLLLRAMGADELPQLWNVLHGEMSMVGPRPCTPFECQLFCTEYQFRCLAPPGMTGLWQVSGKNRTTFEQMMEMDLYYVANASLLMDIKIMLRTVPAVLRLVWEMRVCPFCAKLFKRTAADASRNGRAAV
jgi:lipopolysaccharide/colanic/teichoic acid biosynthesis glycosyltransferase